MGRVRKGTCVQCGEKTENPVLLKGSTWYFIFDQDSSQFQHNPGEAPYKVTMEQWQAFREKRDVYSPVYGKIFPCFFTYCSTCTNRT